VTTGKPAEVKPVAKEESSLPPFTQEQLTYSQSGNIEYLNVKLETGEVFTLKREDGGEWFVSKRVAGKTTDAEILSRVPEIYKLTSESRESLRTYVEKGMKEGLSQKQATISAKVYAKIGEQPPLQQTSDIETLLIQAKNAKPELDAIGTNVAKMFNGNYITRPNTPNDGLKSYDRIKAKADSDYGGNLAKVVDIVGGKIIFDDLDSMYMSLEYLSTNYQLVRIKDKFINPGKDGFRNIIINFKSNNGHIVELQLNIKAIDQAAKEGHKIYETIRKLSPDFEKLTNEERARLSSLKKKSNNLYFEAWQNYLNTK
jgi:hypothetical protein